MERKTQVNAEEGKQEVVITRDFDLPARLLFKAYSEPEIVSQWMGTKVVKLEARNHGSYRFETSDANGNEVVSINGVMHEFIPDERITRTFEMENTPFPIQLEFLEFEKLTDETSRLNMKIVYKSVEDRNQMMKLPFAYGLNMAHDRLQEIVNQFK